MKTVFITGTTSGIGLYAARHMQQLGWQVFAGVLPHEDTSALTEGISERLEIIPIDITQPEMIREAQTIISQQVGQLDGLVNNAGIPMTSPLEIMPMDDLRKIMEVNFFGHVAVSQATIPLVRKAQGRIVNISSILGLLVTPYSGAYSCSKFAIEAFSDALRMELKPWGIKVSKIQPTVINTGIWSKVDEWNEMILAEMPAQHQALYLKKIEQLVQATVKERATGISSQAVAEKIAHALTARHPKARYLVGKRGYLYDFMVRFLPHNLRDKLLLSQLGLG